MDLRCENGIKFGELQEGVLEVKCRSRRCGAREGVVVIHRFDSMTGVDVGTRTFRDPASRKETTNAAHHSSASVRSA
jgi:hypothetical protein